MYSYQVVFKFSDDERIIFAGVTSLSPEKLISQCKGKLVQTLEPLKIENVSYIPKEFCYNGKEKKTS